MLGVSIYTVTIYTVAIYTVAIYTVVPYLPKKTCTDIIGFIVLSDILWIPNTVKQVRRVKQTSKITWYLSLLRVSLTRELDLQLYNKYFFILNSV